MKDEKDGFSAEEQSLKEARSLREDWRRSGWLWPVRGIGSMLFAVGLILLLAVIMAWATFLGMQFGDETSSWAVYHANWFLGLCGLLGLSVLFSALLRFPWKKYQTGFLVTHLGILVLLLGCWIDFEYGQSAYLSIAEGETNSVAVCPNEVHFELRICPKADPKTGKSFPLRKALRFEPGPFSWRFYGSKPLVGWGAGESLPLLPWNFLSRNRSGDVLYSENGCELVVLDYLQSGEIGKEPEGKTVPEPACASDFRWEVAKAGGNPGSSGSVSQMGMKEKLASWPSWVKVRLTVDGESQEFWLRQFDFFSPDGLERNVPTAASQTLFQRTSAAGTEVQLIYAQNTVDLNFALRLDRFHNRLDPGTSMASHYSSDVTLVEKNDPKKELAPNLKVLMNQPIDLFEPGTRQVWRLFQTSFNGPYLNREAASADRDQFYVSSFTVHYSPGRGLLYLGCLLIVLGIGIMFSMKAYFFGRPSHS